MNIRRQLEERLSAALSAVTGTPAPAMVAPSAKPEFGDYQANGIMAAAKAAKTNPRKLAEAVLAKVDLSDLAQKVEIAGPGFINIYLRSEFLSAGVNTLAADAHLGILPPEHPQRVVVDYSAPNLAKEMHVGHLRSSIIGDCLANVLVFTGQQVVRQNHVGDWGTQFGMLLAYWDQLGTTGRSTDIADIEEFYRSARALFDSDEAFARTARDYVVRLQAGDANCIRNWQLFVDQSLRHCEAIYAKLGVKLTRADVRGESAYNDDLPKVVGDLRAKGLLKESQGAQCVFLEEFKDAEGLPLPVIVQKSDGGYLYATTDLAAIRYRVGLLHAGRILYVTGSPQALHFAQVFAVARKAGFAPQDVQLEHIGFGSMLGPDGKPFKTRAGGTVKLMDLLDEAQKRAYELVSKKNADDVAAGRARELDEQRRREVARTVGIGAVKYADLSQNRTSDYVFSYEKILALDGNTAPYMQYAYARVMSIFRKAGLAVESVQASPIQLDQPQERALGLKLLQFSEVIDSVAANCQPNLLCSYLYDLARVFTGFYEACPVLDSPEPVRSSRLALSAGAARVIRTGLELLGIQTVEQM